MLRVYDIMSRVYETVVSSVMDDIHIKTLAILCYLHKVSDQFVFYGYTCILCKYFTAVVLQHEQCIVVDRRIFHFSF